jgi:hypothetical protein
MMPGIIYPELNDTCMNAAAAGVYVQHELELGVSQCAQQRQK